MPLLDLFGQKPNYIPRTMRNTLLSLYRFPFYGVYNFLKLPKNFFVSGKLFAIARIAYSTGEETRGI